MSMLNFMRTGPEKPVKKTKSAAGESQNKLRKLFGRDEK